MWIIRGEERGVGYFRIEGGSADKFWIRSKLDDADHEEAVEAHDLYSALEALRARGFFLRGTV